MVASHTEDIYTASYLERCNGMTEAQPKEGSAVTKFLRILHKFWCILSASYNPLGFSERDPSISY